MQTKCSQSPLPMKPSGSLVSIGLPTRPIPRSVAVIRSLLLCVSLAASACASSSSVPAAVPGDPFASDLARLEEYADLRDFDVAPKTRAWIREADRTIRANNEIAGFKPSNEEDLSWLKRLWISFSRIFTTQ